MNDNELARIRKKTIDDMEEMDRKIDIFHKVLVVIGAIFFAISVILIMKYC